MNIYTMQIDHKSFVDIVKLIFLIQCCWK